MSIAEITKMRTIRFSDNGQTITYVEWLDEYGHANSTRGDRRNPHMKALIARGTREGLKLTSETF